MASQRPSESEPRESADIRRLLQNAGVRDWDESLPQQLMNLQYSEYDRISHQWLPLYERSQLLFGYTPTVEQSFFTTFATKA